MFSTTFLLLAPFFIQNSLKGGVNKLKTMGTISYDAYRGFFLLSEGMKSDIQRFLEQDPDNLVVINPADQLITPTSVSEMEQICENRTFGFSRNISPKLVMTPPTKGRCDRMDCENISLALDSRERIFCMVASDLTKSSTSTTVPAFKLYKCRFRRSLRAPAWSLKPKVPLFRCEREQEAFNQTKSEQDFQLVAYGIPVDDDYRILSMIRRPSLYAKQINDRARRVSEKQR
jgi:hypothetical protein